MTEKNLPNNRPRCCFLAYLLIILLYHIFQPAQGICELPERWRGGWFQSGVQETIYITLTEMSVKGICVESKGEKFIFRDKKLGCYRCVVISEKHINILQYKETLCEPASDISTLCSQIPGDALLFSVFRRDAPPTPCPFKGPLIFSYSQGHGLCSSPPSTIDSCTSDSRLLFKYQACPDVLKTESSVEEVECIGHWKEGSTRYFVGKVDSRRAQTDEDRYRCFAWEKTHGEEAAEVDYRMAQSGDATCNGVFSAYDGSRTLRMKKVGSYTGCEYPSYVTEHRRWHALDTGVTYTVSHRNTTLRLHHNHAHSQASQRLLIDSSQARLVCAQVRDESPSKTVIVSHSTTECTSGYVCTVFYRRDSHLIEIQQGSRAVRASDACFPPYFNSSTVPHTTLLSSSSPHQACPFEGIWSSGPGCSPSITHLRAGCSGHDHALEFLEACDEKQLKHAFVCHGSWHEGQRTFLVVSPEGRINHRFCLVATSQSHLPSVLPSNKERRRRRSISPTDNDTIVITTHAHSCPRHEVPPTTTINVSFTTHSSCHSLSDAISYTSSIATPVILASLMLQSFVIQLWPSILR